MGCRMNQKSLTPAQRAAFANAVLALKNKVPSQLGLSNRYDDYVQTHMNSMMATPGWAHQGPTFEPWHRELLYQFEKDLQVRPVWGGHSGTHMRAVAQRTPLPI